MLSALSESSLQIYHCCRV